jgi:hypothetical protein
LCQYSRCGGWLQGFSFNVAVLTQGQPALGSVAAAAVLEILCPLAMAMGQKQGMRNMPKHHNTQDLKTRNICVNILFIYVYNV